MQRDFWSMKTVTFFFFLEIVSSFGCVAAAAVSHDGGPCDAWDDSVAITDIENLAP